MAFFIFTFTRKNAAGRHFFECVEMQARRMFGISRLAQDLHRSLSSSTLSSLMNLA